MADNPVLPGNGTPIEGKDIGAGVIRQSVTISDRAGGAVDSIGGLTETAPTTDTASAGLNGRLQRIAQNITNIGAALGEEYETVAASQTAQALGATGATGDYIAGILVISATTAPGNVLLLDNATSITVFVGGASSVSNLVPFFVPLGIKSISGAWKITTGANVSVIAIGNFT